MIDKKKQLLNVIAQALFDKNGQNIYAVDISAVSGYTDYLIIAEGTVDRHVKALANKVVEAAKTFGEAPALVEGQSEGNWIVIDYLDVIVHLFTKELRQYYSLEELWSDGNIVDLEIITNGKDEDE